MPETVLQQCQRHIAEGAERISKQEGVIASIQRGGHNHLLPGAQRLLLMFRDIQALSQEHLARELAKGSGNEL